MNFGRTPNIGRFIIDIDGALKSTDLPALSSHDVAALRPGGSHEDIQVFIERYGSLIPLAGAERVVLDTETVAFFRTTSVPRHAAMASGNREPLPLAA